MSEVIEIGEFRLRRAQRKSALRDCRHMSLELDYELQTVRCADCGEHMSPFYALSHLTDALNRKSDQLTRDRENLRQLQSGNLHLIAARRVEEAWRSRTMVPTCPHCDEAIFPGDGFGSSAVNKDMAKKRRAARLESARGKARA